VCGEPRQFVGARAYLNQWGIAMRVTWPSVFSNMAEIDSVLSLNAVSRNKKLASLRQADVPTNFNPIWPQQKICSSTTCTTKNRLVCGSTLAQKGPKGLKGMPYFWPQWLRIHTLWGCTSLQAEVSHNVNDGRETSAGFRRVVWWSRRPNFWSKLTGFQNWFRLMCYARALLD